MEKKQKILKEAKAFEFYVNWIWPMHRVFVKSKISKRCQLCILSERQVTLNKQGVCELCEQHMPDSSIKETNTELSNELSKILTEHQGKGVAQYDALVLFSGGKDSSLLIDKLEKEYPDLRILALTVDNTFMSPVAMENINLLVELLDVDHMTVRPPRALYKRMFSYGFLNLNEKGCSGTVDQMDGDFFHDVARNTAKDLKIPLVISGCSKAQVERILGLSHFESDPHFEAKKRETVAHLKISDFAEKEDLHFWWDGENCNEDQRPRVLYPYYAWNLSEEEILSLVSNRNLLPQGQQSPIITNNSLIPLMGVVDVLKFGYSSFEGEFAEMVRKGKAERAKWLHTFEFLEYTAKTGAFIKESIKISIKELGLNPKDLKISYL